MNLLKEKFKDRIYLAGLSCIALSLAIFCLPFIVKIKEESTFSLFVLNFLITWVYFLVRVFNRKETAKEDKLHHLFLLLILSLISAYSLNRELPVFDTSADWFAGLLVFLCINYTAFAFFETMPARAKHLLSFINGAALITFFYLAVYLMPMYAVGLIGTFLLGVSLHTFVPLLFVIYTLVLQNRVSESNKKQWVSFFSGILAVLFFIGIYLIQWNNISNRIDAALHKAEQQKAVLPTWVIVSQSIPQNNLSKKILKTDLVYSTSEPGYNFFWGLPGVSFWEDREHDPLVMIATFCLGKIDLQEDDKIKLLESMHDRRHEAEERLWSDDHLYTDFVNTAVQLWPKCNMAYTEKTITVTNDSKMQGLVSREEALYTFYMPEGAVVTSLSLWIGDREEKGILTTKELADSAYKTIVGVERRDPSVVHWQEGNSVLVRVFPVMNGESRKFKIGITSPLERINGKLRYENIYFKGPAFDNATENILVNFEQPAADFQVPASFASMPDQQSYKRQGSYTPDWSMQIRDAGLSDCSFSFAGNNYYLSPYHKKLSSAQLDNIYLDINAAWTKDEFNKVLDFAKGKRIFVYPGKIISLDDSNKQSLWDELKNLQFTLFPLYEIKNPEQSLVITKSSLYSPNLDDLDNCGFMERTKQFLAGSSKIRLFSIGNLLPPYLKSLKELRVFQYDSGDMNMLHRVLQRNHFADDPENDNNVIIHRSDMMITKAKGEFQSTGPDHLMRLFSYNHIMQKLGKDLLTKRPIEDSLVAEARKAYVVSPVSSLVVLETQKDYDRFNIHDTDDSLKNASMKSRGAVPEPHEWALIILVVAVLIFVRKKRNSQLSI